MKPWVDSKASSWHSSRSELLALHQPSALAARAGEKS